MYNTNMARPYTQKTHWPYPQDRMFLIAHAYPRTAFLTTTPCWTKCMCAHRMNNGKKTYYIFRFIFLMLLLLLFFILLLLLFNDIFSSSSVLPDLAGKLTGTGFFFLPIKWKTIHVGISNNILYDAVRIILS